MDFGNYQWKPTAFCENSVPLPRGMAFTSEINYNTCPLPFGFRQQLQNFPEPDLETFKKLKRNNLGVKNNKEMVAEQPAETFVQLKSTHNLFSNQDIRTPASNLFTSGNLFSSTSDQRNSLFNNTPATLTSPVGQATSLFGQNPTNTLDFGGQNQLPGLTARPLDSGNKQGGSNQKYNQEEAGDSEFGDDDGFIEDSEEFMGSDELVSGKELI